MKILVVDDDEAVRLVVREMLAKEMHEVECVASGREALVKIADSTYDLILLDVGMPRMNGVEVFLNMKQTHPNQRVVFVTGFAEEDISRYLDDCTSVLRKPFSLDDLHTAVDTA